MPATMTQQPAAPPAPAAPAAPPAPVSMTQPALMPGVPRTAQEMAALRSTRSQLSDQLQSAESRREEIAEALRGEHGEPPPAPEDRAGLVERMRVLDSRILQIESDIASTGRAMAAAPPALLTSSTTQPSRDPIERMIDRTNPTAISGIFSVFVLGPIALAYARRIWRRPAPPPVIHGFSDAPQRLERMEQAIDAIAVEVERISEGQRFVTRLLGEANGFSEVGVRTVAMGAQQDALPIPRAER